MARIFEPARAKRCTDSKITMNILQARMLQEQYQVSKDGFEVNDGKYMKYINDKEEANDSNLQSMR